MAPPWSLFPLLAWGVGLVQHVLHARTLCRDADEAAALAPLDDEQAKMLRSLFANRSGLRHHLAAVGTSSLLLLVIQLVTRSRFPWVVFPVTGMAVGAFTHLVSAKVVESNLLDKLEARGVRLPGRRAVAVSATLEGSDAESSSPLLLQAARLRDGIVADLEGTGSGAARWRAELVPQLDSYTSHLDELVRIRSKLERVAAPVTTTELEHSLTALREKADTASSDALRGEYRGRSSSTSSSCSRCSSWTNGSSSSTCALNPQLSLCDWPSMCRSWRHHPMRRRHCSACRTSQRS